MGIEVLGNKGKEAGSRIGYPFEIDRAIEHLNIAIDTLIVAERKYKESGQLLDENTIMLFRRKIVNIKNDIARAIAL